MDNCKVIAITNQKGGVGKTTTTVNLGVGLSMYHDKKVLLIDADPQSSLTASLLKGQNPDQLEMTLTTVMEATIEDRPIDEFSGILHHDEGVDLLPSNIELSGMETGLFNIMSREYVLRNYIDSVRKNYDYILIDCMPSLGMMTINALVAADSVIIPSQPSFLSTKGLNLLLHSINKIKRGINPSLKIDGILFTMVNNRTNNAKDIIGAMRDTVGQNIILPQLTADFTSTIIYRFDMNLRDATVLGLVGAGGIGAPLIFAMSSYRWNEVGAILLGLIVLVLIIEWISSGIRIKLARG